jgi:hypothetical protein
LRPLLEEINESTRAKIKARKSWHRFRPTALYTKLALAENSNYEMTMAPDALPLKKNRSIGNRRRETTDIASARDV